MQAFNTKRKLLNSETKNLSFIGLNRQLSKKKDRIFAHGFLATGAPGHNHVQLHAAGVQETTECSSYH